MLYFNPHTFYPLRLKIGSPLSDVCYAFVDIWPHVSLAMMNSIAPKKIV